MIFAYISAAILTALSALHVYWAFGGKAFTGLVIPENSEGRKIFNPGRAVTLTVAVVLFAGACVLIIQNTSPTKISTLLTIVYAVIFFIRGIGDFRYMGISKRVTGTDFAYADTLLFTPLVFALSFAFFFSITR